MSAGEIKLIPLYIMHLWSKQFVVIKNDMIQVPPAKTKIKKHRTTEKKTTCLSLDVMTKKYNHLT